MAARGVSPSLVSSSVAQYAQKYGVDPNALAANVFGILGQELHFGTYGGPDGSGTSNVAQVNPATAKQFGVNVNVNNPNGSVQAATAIVAQLMARFGPSAANSSQLTTAVADAYNGGTSAANTPAALSLHTATDYAKNVLGFVNGLVGVTPAQPAGITGLTEAGLLGLGPNGVLGNIGHAAPVGQVTASPLSGGQFGSQFGPYGNMGNPALGQAAGISTQGLFGNQGLGNAPSISTAGTLGGQLGPASQISTAGLFGPSQGIYGNVGNPAFGQPSQTPANPHAAPMGSVTSATPSLAALFGQPANPALQGAGGQPATFRGGQRVI